MKKIFTILLVIVALNTNAQTPEKISYQAVIRNSSNELATNQNVGMQISILSGSITGTPVYVERHFPTTNGNGLVALEIGTGVLISGDFASIDWVSGTFFIKSETDLNGGASYTITGVSQLLSVPYALHAKSAESITGTLDETDPVYSAWDKSTGISITEGQISDLQKYLTTEVDGSVTNEIQDLNLDRNILKVTNNASATDVDLSKYLDDKTVTITAGDGIEVTGDYPNFTVTKKPYNGAIYRWAVFSSYNQVQGWYAGNDASLFGGVNPSNWGDGSAIASQMSSEKDVLLTLFSKKGYAGKNALVCAEEWLSYSSTNSKHAAALFRIENTTNSTITWTVITHQSSYGGWGERASVALNGENVWNSGGSNYYTNTAHTHTLSIPANRVSTVIFISGSTPAVGNSRGLILSFQNNSLELPTGLKYVDDLDTALDGWDN
jgi:hypothetical protein